VNSPLAATRELEVLDRVGDVDLRAGDPGVLERGVEQVAGRPDERVAGAISTSPGCSPTITIRAVSGPSPNTACVASRYSEQPRQSGIASRSAVRV